MTELIGIDEALRTHLQYNFYPPVTLAMVNPCKEAIDFCNKGLSDQNVRCGEALIPAWKIVDELHLDEWLTEDCIY